jgi:glycosyltransferase involved in cell wall biosynthesis
MIMKWRPSEDVGNFGDELSIILLDFFTNSSKSEMASPHNKYFLVGSVINEFWLDALPATTQGNTFFWGCGFRDEEVTPSKIKDATFFGVRGIQTKKYLEQQAIFTEVIGDPGLLMPLRVKKSKASGRSIFMPHILDPNRYDYNPKELGVDEIIQPDVKNKKELVQLIKRISGASFVFSGAMHAAVIAAAYGIPFGFYGSKRIDIPVKYSDFISAFQSNQPVSFYLNAAKARTWYNKFSSSAHPVSMYKLLTTSPGKIKPIYKIKALVNDAKNGITLKQNLTTARMMRKRTLFIEAGALLEEKMSGVGHATMNIIQELSSRPSFTQDYDIKLLVASNKADTLERFHLNTKVKTKKIYIKARILNGLAKYNLLPPMDLLFGKGIYLFPNFKNWPLVRSRSITYIHDVAFKLFPQFVQPKNLKMLENSVDTFLKRTDHIVTVSKSSRDELLQAFTYVADDKVSAVQNGIDPTLFTRRNAKEIQRLRKKYNLPKKYFIFLSSIEPRKNLKMLLEAYRLLPTHIQKESALLLIGGMGWLNDDIIAKINELRQAGITVIKPTSFVPDEDLPGLLSGAVTLIHPAYHEGFGLPPLEALACGTPVIVSDIPVMHEVVGSVGTYFKNLTDPHELCQLMENHYNKQYSSEDRQEFRRQALKFTWPETLRRLEEIIREVDRD